jgi:pseudaminic acid synthase
MKIKNINIGINYPPIIIAEMSGNHNQSLKNAIKIVEKAKKCGLKFLKIQTYTPDTITLKSNRKDFFIRDKKNIWYGQSLYNLYKKAYTPWEWHEAIFKRAKELGIICFSTPFDPSSVDFLESLKVPAYKIASFEITDFPLIKKVAQTNKPIILSTGMASKNEIAEAIDLIKKSGNSSYAILKCTSSYPADPKNINLKTIIDMRKKSKCEVGLSDHTLGIGVAIASIPFKTTIIEKHFTLNRRNGGVDSKFSIEPDEMMKLVNEVNSAWKSIGKIKYGCTESEKKSLNHRKSIYITKDMKKGEIITQKNIKVNRPAFGLHSKYFDKVIG